MKVHVRVTLKPGILDPQGKAIGKVIEIELAETDPTRIRQQTEAMCKQLLANPVTEDYAIEIIASG